MWRTKGLILIISFFKTGFCISRLNDIKYLQKFWTHLPTLAIFSSSKQRNNRKFFRRFRQETINSSFPHTLSKSQWPDIIMWYLFYSFDSNQSILTLNQYILYHNFSSSLFGNRKFRRPIFPVWVWVEYLKTRCKTKYLFAIFSPNTCYGHCIFDSLRQG